MQKRSESECVFGDVGLVLAVKRPDEDGAATLARAAFLCLLRLRSPRSLLLAQKVDK